MNSGSAGTVVHLLAKVKISIKANCWMSSRPRFSAIPNPKQSSKCDMQKVDDENRAEKWWHRWTHIHPFPPHIYTYILYATVLSLVHRNKNRKKYEINLNNSKDNIFDRGETTVFFPFLLLYYSSYTIILSIDGMTMRTHNPYIWWIRFGALWNGTPHTQKRCKWIISSVMTQSFNES